MPRNDIRPKKVKWSPGVANFAVASAGTKAVDKLNVWRGTGTVEHRHFITNKNYKNR